MSKRLKNYPPPSEIMDKYGADALRLYLVSSPVVCAQELRFKEEDVKKALKTISIPWYNAFRFLMLVSVMTHFYADIEQKRERM